jgi:hypothetical protein
MKTPIKSRPESSPSKHTHSTPDSTPSKSSFTRLERQYTDLIIKYNNLASDYAQLELDLSSKLSLIEESKAKNKKLEAYIKMIQDEYNENKALLTQEIKSYEQSIVELQLRNKKLTQELMVKEDSDHPTNYVDLAEYEKLAHDLKILQTNFELEQSSKLILMDQIELLSKENEQLKSDTYNQPQPHLHSHSIEKSQMNDSDDSVLHYVHNSSIEHTMNRLTDDDDDDDDEEDMAQSHFSSNISLQENILSNLDSFDAVSNFQFPPSPDPETKLKRQSLPAQLKEEFILSPLKLACHTNLYFEGATDSPRVTKRYMKGHSRYNSHDIVPIKVEFEPIETRSTSVPEHQLHKTFIEEECESDTMPEKVELDERSHAYKALIGELSTAPTSSSTAARNSMVGDITWRNSLMSSSSKRSSMIEEPAMTKQEIMKLKFELQSLRLHNEKLLSYIGFELQKQKVNLEQLSKGIEYSDSKLIEKSREELIHKKRVLRSVSINSILSKKYSNHDNATIIGKGILSNYVFDNEDDYGFLTHNDQFSKRIFSRGLQQYFHDEEIDEEVACKTLKNHKSLKNLHFEYNEIDDEDYDEMDESVESIYDQVSSDEEIGIINQFKHMILGGSKKKYMKNKEELVDDRLKYKFMAITLGIMIIGLKISHPTIQQP